MTIIESIAILPDVSMVIGVVCVTISHLQLKGF